MSVALERVCDTGGDPAPYQGRLGVVNTVIIPAYNEELGLPVVLKKVLSIIDHTFEVLVVDDGSDDRTAEVAGRYPVRLISHRVNQGKGRAMMTGIGHARGENVIFIDADDTYPAEGILDIAAALKRCDMALGSRTSGHQNIPAFNRIGNAVFRNSIRYLFGFKACDPLTGLYGIKKKIVARMNLTSPGFGIESEIAIKAGSMGLKMQDIPIVYRERIGQAKLNGLRDGFRIGCTIASYLPRYNPFVAFVLPGLLLLLAGLADGGAFSFPSLGAVLSLLAVPAGVQLILWGLAGQLYSVKHLNCRKGTMVQWLLRWDTVKNLVGGGLTLVALSLAALVGTGLHGVPRAVPVGLVGLSAVLSGLFLHGFGGYRPVRQLSDKRRIVRVFEAGPR